MVRLLGDEFAHRLTPEVELALYRVVQESLTNASVHGNASTTWVALRSSGDGLELLVRDDGEGLPVEMDVTADTDRLVAAGHFGLVGMHERARSIGASLALGPGPGGFGTEVRLLLPKS